MSGWGKYQERLLLWTFELYSALQRVLAEDYSMTDWRNGSAFDSNLGRYQKVACSSHVSVISFCRAIECFGVSGLAFVMLILPVP